MSSFIFDYSVFYDYYTDSRNLLQDHNQKDYLHFFLDIPRRTRQQSTRIPYPTYYITINGVKVYITLLNKRRILFTLPTFIDNAMWANHYHFGLDLFVDRTSNLKPKPKIPLVFFHKTVQNPPQNGKQEKRCFFRNGCTISEIETVICEQEKNTIMSDKFPFDFPQDIEFIKEIIARPFIGIVNFGGSTIQTGKKGGKYIIKDGKKRYVTKSWIKRISGMNKFAINQPILSK